MKCGIYTSSYARICIYILLIYIIFPFASMSATQGTVGTTSLGTTDVNISLGDAARISYIDDSVFGTYGGTGNLTSNDDMCVYSNTAGGTYNVTATGSGTAGAFTLSDGGPNTLVYAVRFNDVAGTNSGGINLTTGVTLTGQTGADTSSVDCTGGSVLNSRVRVRITAANLAAATAGTYTGTLTLSIAPE